METHRRPVATNNNSHQRQNLVLSFSELNDLNETEQMRYYFTAEEAFFGDSIFQFVADEVNAILQFIMLRDLCDMWGCGTCRSFYNPVYAVLFVIFYVITFPGAWLHWLMFDLIPVRVRENAEERELRSQGIYVALGLAVVSIPFEAAGFYLGDSLVQLINLISLCVSCALILFNLIGLKALGGELNATMKTYTIGIFLILLVITGLALFDVYYFIYASWLTILSYSLRLLAILVYAVIAVNITEFWGLYYESSSNGNVWDVLLTVSLVALLAIVLGGFAYTVLYISEEDAWAVMF